MPVTRRQLLKSLAAVAGAMAARRAGADVVTPASPPPLTAREAHYLAEHKWAAQGLLRALASNDFAPWQPGEESERPSRWRLARSVVELQDETGLSPLEATLRKEFIALWSKLSRGSLYQ